MTVLTSPAPWPQTTKDHVELRDCVRCRYPVLIALDDNGWPTAVDPRPITDDAVVAAMYLDGRRVYGLVFDNRLVFITPATASGSFGLRKIQLAEHFCSQPIPIDWLAPIDLPRKEISDEPKF